MKVADILLYDFVDRDTSVFIRDSDFHVLAHGFYFFDCVLDYAFYCVYAFCWEDGNVLYINISEKEG